MRLSDRLEMVISTVRPAECVADIGTDHGFVPVELVRREIAERALAMDVRPGPLSRAVEHIEAAALTERIETRLSDGLLKLSPGEANAVVIAGMGGELIIRILEGGRVLWDSVDQWVLSPHSEIAKMRRWLSENGFDIRKEKMVFEDGKYYTIMDVGRSEGAHGTDREFLYGRSLIESKDSVFLEFLKDEEQKLKTLCETLSAQIPRSDRAEKGLKDAMERLSYNREVQDEMQ